MSAQKTHKRTAVHPQPNRIGQAQAHTGSGPTAPLKSSRRSAVIWAVAATLGLVLTAAALLATRASTTSAASAKTAPDFTLQTTAAATVSLSALRETPVVLYFNEGAGCGSCTYQTAEIEKDPAFLASGVRLLPIVMNTAGQIEPDRQRFKVTTPYLLDDGTVSKAYDVLGKGMHAGLPGHGFVFIDKTGTQRWAGNYPSMWLPPADLLKQIQPYP